MMPETAPQTQFLLLKDRRFLPLFITQFTGAFNDNMFKSALSVMVAYGLIATGAWKPDVVVSLTAGLLILPYIALGPLAGDLADKFEKAHLMRLLKVFEIIIIGAAVVSLFSHNVVFLLAVLVLFGCQAALFSPAKFSILPQHLKEQELIGGNALLNTGTYLAILAGTILGSLLGMMPHGRMVLSIIFIASGLGGYFASLFIPAAPPPAPHLKLRKNIFGDIGRILQYAAMQPFGVFPAILGISWFYFTGALVLSQFPVFTKTVLQADSAVLAFLMAVFSAGVALGGLLNNKLLRAKIEAKFVPLAGVGMAVFLCGLFFVPVMGHEVLIPLRGFLYFPLGWFVTLDVLLLAVCGGLYVIPLKSIVQHRTGEARRARVMAASAMMDAVFILVSSILAALLLSLGLNVGQLFLGLSVATLAASVYLKKLKEAA